MTSFRYFPRCLLVQEIDVDGRMWRKLLEPLVVGWSINGDQVWELVVPAGFVTDYASTPRFLWPIFPPDGEYRVAAIVHDYLYRCGRMTRKLADAIFQDAMVGMGVPRWRRAVLYYGVRWFGGRVWRGKR